MSRKVNDIVGEMGLVCQTCKQGHMMHSASKTNGLRDGGAGRGECSEFKPPDGFTIMDQLDLAKTRRVAEEIILQEAKQNVLSPELDEEERA